MKKMKFIVASLALAWAIFGSSFTTVATTDWGLVIKSAQGDYTRFTVVDLAEANLVPSCSTQLTKTCEVSFDPEATGIINQGTDPNFPERQIYDIPASSVSSLVTPLPNSSDKQFSYTFDN